MTLFLSTLEQMAYLLLLLFLGWFLVKRKVLPDTAASILSKLESNLFIPALMFGTFVQNFTPDRIGTAGTFLLCGTAVVLLSMPVGLALGKLCAKDPYLRRICAYGLVFSNFGFMGNAVVEALFPEVFLEYLIYVLPFWTGIYVWGVPALLIPAEGGKSLPLKERLRPLLNPMFLAVLAGMAAGIIRMPMPTFATTAVTNLGACMSPVAMLLTGMTVAKIQLKPLLRDSAVWRTSLLRLIAIPVAVIGLLQIIPLPRELALCTVCALSMPLGLNAIVIPSAYGKDTTAAAGMALVSHLLSVGTIPLVFALFLAL